MQTFTQQQSVNYIKSIYNTVMRVMRDEKNIT